MQLAHRSQCHGNRQGEAVISCHGDGGPTKNSNFNVVSVSLYLVEAFHTLHYYISYQVHKTNGFRGGSSCQAWEIPVLHPSVCNPDLYNYISGRLTLPGVHKLNRTYQLINHTLRRLIVTVMVANDHRPFPYFLHFEYRCLQIDAMYLGSTTLCLDPILLGYYPNLVPRPDPPGVPYQSTLLSYLCKPPQTKSLF